VQEVVASLLQRPQVSIAQVLLLELPRSFES